MKPAKMNTDQSFTNDVTAVRTSGRVTGRNLRILEPTLK